MIVDAKWLSIIYISGGVNTHLSTEAVNLYGCVIPSNEVKDGEKVQEDKTHHQKSKDPSNSARYYLIRALQFSGIQHFPLSFQDTIYVSDYLKNFKNIV